MLACLPWRWAETFEAVPGRESVLGSDALDGLPDCLSLNCYPQVTDLARLDEGRLRLVIDTVESLRPSKTALAFKSFGALISPCVVYFVS